MQNHLREICAAAVLFLLQSCVLQGVPVPLLMSCIAFSSVIDCRPFFILSLRLLMWLRWCGALIGAVGDGETFTAMNYREHEGGRSTTLEGGKVQLRSSLEKETVLHVDFCKCVPS
jgi:hypothetical protein